MDKFLSHSDETALLIDRQAAELHRRLTTVDVDKLGMPDYCLHYFKLSHSTRLFFSIETSAHLLYRASKLSGKALNEIVLMDYGAGVGTLFLLAKMIGCKQVIYNDHLEDWRKSAELIAKAISVDIDLYVVGDIDDSLLTLDTRGIKCDVITSRNVIEHIYKLNDFYSAIYAKQPQAVILSSTTANKLNPASLVKHVLWHRKWEKVYRGMRLAEIRKQLPGLAAERLNQLAVATRGLALDDMRYAIDNFRKDGSLPDPSMHGSNTCDPTNGVWAEHLLGINEYKSLIDERKYHVTFEAGFWDTHYRKPYMNAIGKMFNAIIRKGGNAALRVAPFIYVIAIPRLKKTNE